MCKQMTTREANKVPHCHPPPLFAAEKYPVLYGKVRKLEMELKSQLIRTPHNLPFIITRAWPSHEKGES